jgi:GntR family transcriptional regulator
MLDFELNPTLGIPIYRQIMVAVRGRIAAGLLKPGDRLPSIRELAAKLRINPASAVKAYTELRHAGVIALDHGRGTFVAERTNVIGESREELLRLELANLLQRTQAFGFDDEEVVRALRSFIKASREAGHSRRKE